MEFRDGLSATLVMQGGLGIPNNNDISNQFPNMILA